MALAMSINDRAMSDDTVLTAADLREAVRLAREPQAESERGELDVCSWCGDVHVAHTPECERREYRSFRVGDTVRFIGNGKGPPFNVHGRINDMNLYGYVGAILVQWPDSHAQRYARYVLRDLERVNAECLDCHVCLVWKAKGEVFRRDDEATEQARVAAEREWQTAYLASVANAASPAPIPEWPFPEPQPPITWRSAQRGNGPASHAPNPLTVSRKPWER